MTSELRQAAIDETYLYKSQSMPTPQEIIEALELKPLPLEGGYYHETYRSPDVVSASASRGARSGATAIYYLLTADTHSALHRLPADEIFHFYAGGPVRMLQLRPDGSGDLVLLGSDVLAGQRPQVVVSRGVWQGSFLAPGAEFALLGTTMAPGFDFSDYEAGDRAALSAQYPEFSEIIRRLT
jgi:predicted cupin superfamily sugar epimerase